MTMKPIDFAYWLQGFLSSLETQNLSETHYTLIKEKLDALLSGKKEPLHESY